MSYCQQCASLESKLEERDAEIARRTSDARSADDALLVATNALRNANAEIARLRKFESIVRSAMVGLTIDDRDFMFDDSPAPRGADMCILDPGERSDDEPEPWHASPAPSEKK